MKLNKNFKYAIIHSRDLSNELILLQNQLLKEWKITLKTIHYLQKIEFDYKNLQERLKKIKRTIKEILKGGAENAKESKNERKLSKNSNKNKNNKYKPDN